MLSRFRLYPYGPSNTANDLVEAMNGLLIRRVGSKYHYRNNHVVVNWGASSRPPVLVGVPCLNPPEAVANAASKRRTFAILHAAGVRVPESTADRGIAQGWVQDSKVLGRDLDNGSQGRGITVYPRRAELGAHKFYVKYVRKQRELRYHVYKGKVIFIQEKMKKKGYDGIADKYVRSHHRGWCFAFHHFGENPVPPAIEPVANSAVAALGLDFGAVDIGWNERDGCTVFEVNTAPGLENSSLEAYVEAFNGN